MKILAALVLLACISPSLALPRLENIRDDEVQEIQRLLAKELPGEIVHIGTVQHGCNCREPVSCTDELRVAVDTPVKGIRRLSLSRNEGRWRVSRVAEWNRRMRELKARLQAEQEGKKRWERSRIAQSYTPAFLALWAEEPVCKAAPPQ